jgi:hypothetical protein
MLENASLRPADVRSGRPVQKKCASARRVPTLSIGGPMIKATGLGLFVAIVAVALGIRSKPLQAEDQIDCSKASKWVDNHTYNKGDLVWWSTPGETEYRCNETYCFTPIPTHFWDKVGVCRFGTAK